MPELIELVVPSDYTFPLVIDKTGLYLLISRAVNTIAL